MGLRVLPSFHRLDESAAKPGFRPQMLRWLARLRGMPVLFEQALARLGEVLPDAAAMEEDARAAPLVPIRRRGKAHGKGLGKNRGQRRGR